MDEMYNEIRDHLRKSHYQNTQEIYQRERSPIYQYHYCGKNDVRGADEQHTSRTFFLKLKMIIFLAGVLTFSCYIYGGQDIEKGANMAVSEIKTELSDLEQREPKVKEAMVYVRKAYHKVCDFADDYLPEDPEAVD